MKPDYKLVAKAKYIQLVAAMAQQLWAECYRRWYNPKQLAAIIEALQSAEAIEADIDAGANYFVVQLGGKPVGYFAWRTEGAALHLLHIYLQPAVRGKAMGRDIIASCERLARSEGKGRVYCTVHAKALPVVAFFKARGYRIVRPAEQLVAGTVMDLVEMEHLLR